MLSLKDYKGEKVVISDLPTAAEQTTELKKLYAGLSGAAVRIRTIAHHQKAITFTPQTPKILRLFERLIEIENG
jgi:hypothetical protein